MEVVSKSFLQLSERIKMLISSYNSLLKNNEELKNRVALLEGELLFLKKTLEEKKFLLNEKEEDSIFVSMLIDDLLNSVGDINKRDLLHNNGISCEQVSLIE